MTALKEALPIQRELGDDNRQSLCLSNIGATYVAKGDYEEARTYLERALELREKANVPRDISATLSNLGGVSTIIGDYDRAQKQYLRALDLSRKADDKRGAAIASLGLGFLYQFQGRYGAALESEAEALKTLRELNERSTDFVQALAGFGLALAAAGRSEESAKHLAEAMIVAKELKSEALVAQVLNYQGDGAYYRGDLKGARSLFDQAAQAAKRGSSRIDGFQASVNLAKITAEETPQAALPVIKGLMRQVDEAGLKYMSAECSLYLGMALVGAKDTTQARVELESAVTKSQRLSARALLARSHYFLGEAQRSGAASTTHHSKAQELLEEMKREARADGLVARHDLKALSKPAGAVIPTLNRRAGPEGPARRDVYLALTEEEVSELRHAEIAPES